MPSFPRLRVWCWLLWMGLILFPAVAPVQGEELDAFDLQVKAWAGDCKNAVTDVFDRFLQSGELTEAQLFDTFYIPIPNTSPQKFHTQYDRSLDEALRKILDGFLTRSDRLVFVVAVDVNGYLPTHNSRYDQPLTGDAEKDILNSRSKRIFNDRTGLAAARSIRPFLLQRYFRDTGEEMFDLSVPLFIRDRHWGAIRFGYRHP